MQAPPNLSPQQQQEVVRFQQLQQSLEMIMQQKSTLEVRLNETTLAVRELESTDENGVVYQSVGGLMIKRSQTDVLESSKDRQETLTMRVKSLGEQEKRLKTQYEEQKKKVQQMMNVPAQ